MKRLTCLTIATAAVLLCSTSATGGPTACAFWNDGPASDPGWDPADPAMDADYPAWSPECGLHHVWAVGDAVDAVSGFPWVSPRRYPNADGVGKWGGALKDDVGDGCMYVTLQDGLEYPDGPPTFADDQGTVEFWFKPMWDPSQDTNGHMLFCANKSDANEDGLYIRYNGDGTMTTQMRNYSNLIDVGHDWTSNPLAGYDWNHVAVVWDSAGTYSYCNGSKVGETIYSGSAPATMNWAQDWMCGVFGAKAGYTSYQSDGMWDVFITWDEVRYSGQIYTMPTVEPWWWPRWPPNDPSGDGFWGHADLDIVLAMWGNSGVDITDPRADINEDDSVGQIDLDFVLADWGQGTPPSSPIPEPAALGIFALCGFALLRRKPKSR